MARRTGDVTDNPESKELLVKQAGTILVYDFPSKLSQNDIWIYFQKKKNEGGEVLQVSMRADTHDALVHFEDYKVAEAVVQRQNHVIKGYAVKVKLYKAEDDKKRRTVLVSGLPHDATKDSITIHFQTKKLGGGEVEDVQKLGEGKAMVVFKDFEVAKTIVNIKQTFEGSTVLTLKHMGMELDPTEAIKQGDIDIVGKENRTVLVSELPQGVSKNVVFIHFQKKKNNGGEVEEVTLLPEGNKAWVIFEDPKVAEKVVNTDQTIREKPVRVKLLTTETQPAERSVEPGTILVSGLPEGMTKNDITMHFRRKRNGGGEVRNVQLSSDGKQAAVTFDDLKVAKTAVSSPQVIKTTTVTVTLLDNEKELVKETPPEKIVPNPEVTRTPDVRTPPESMGTPEVATTREVQPPEVPTDTKNFETEENPSGTKTEKTMPDKVNPFFLVRQVDHVFSIVSATVDPAIINSAPQDFWNNVFNVIQTSCGVQLGSSAYGIMLSGSFSQVARAGELLGLQWARHCQGQQLGYNFVNQVGMPFNPTTLNQFGTTSIWHDRTFTNSSQSNMHMYQGSIYNNQICTNVTACGMGQIGAHLNQAGTNLNQYATAFNSNPQPLGSQQPPGYVAKSLNPTCMEYGASEKMTGPSSAKPAPSPDSTRNPQSSDNGQKGTSPDTTRTGENTTPTVDDNTSPEFRSEKLPGLSETTINLQPQGGNQQSATTDPTSRLQNSTNFSNEDGLCLNDQPDAYMEKLPPDNGTPQNPTIGPPHSVTADNQTGVPPLTSTSEADIEKLAADSVIIPQPPSNDQKGTPKNPTIGSPNLATSAHQTGVPPSTNTSDCLIISGKPPTTTEKTPNNQQYSQEQTSPDQIFNKQISTDENVEISPNNSPASHPVVPPRDVTEQTKNSKNKQQKRTPTPLPRQNKTGTNERRHNAANFSSPGGKTKQPSQDSPAPTESNSNSDNEKPLAATGPKEEGDQNTTTKKSKTSIPTEERDDTTLDELETYV